MYGYDSIHTSRSASCGSPTNSTLWATPLSIYPIASTPAVSADGNTIYIATRDATLYALSPVDGGLLWQAPLGPDGTQCVASPAVDAGGAVYVGTVGVANSGCVLAFNGSTGVLLWSYNVSSPVLRYVRLYVRGVGEEMEMVMRVCTAHAHAFARRSRS